MSLISSIEEAVRECVRMAMSDESEPMAADYDIGFPMEAGTR